MGHWEKTCTQGEGRENMKMVTDELERGLDSLPLPTASEGTSPADT